MAELAAIAEGLAIATTEVLLSRGNQKSTSPKKEAAAAAAAKPKVIIFTDSTSALQKIDKLRKSVVAEDRLRDDAVVRKIITRSQYLRRIGIPLELRWVPGHSRVEGNTRADVAARLAAKSENIAVLLDEGLRLIEMEDAPGNVAEQQNTPREKSK